VVLSADATHHLRSVLRLSTGAAIIVFDNSGQEYECEITDCRPSQTRARILRAAAPRVESPIKITLAQAMLKGNAFDRTLTLCAELGAARIIPVISARTVVRMSKAQAADRVPRWEKILQEAAAQSGRVRVPALEMPVDFKELLERKKEGLKLILWEKAGSGQLRQILEEEKVEAVTLLVGPEGGFEQAEVRTALEAGYQIWGLGPRTLRAEHSGAIAISLLQFALGDLG